jgi:signal transduction histidine kinase
MTGQRRHGAHPDERERARTADQARRRAEADAAAERRIADHFAQLHVATAALSAALTPSEVARVVAARAAALPGATGSAVGLLDARSLLEVSATCGASERAHGRLPSVTAAADLLSDAVRARCPVFVDGGAALPLEAAGELLGAVAVAFDRVPCLDEEERAFLQAFAHWSAQALERARLYAREREARLEAQRAEESARTAVELQERLVAVVGHDLRTPLSAIRMSAGLLARRGSLSEDQVRVVARIGASAERMTRIIHDLLDFTRVRRGGAIPLEPRRADLVDVCLRAVAELRAAHPDREIVLDLPREAWLTCDPDRVAQVVSNLVGNALEHSPSGSEIRVALTTSADGEVLVVHNGGPPIPPELTGEIFEPFRRGPHGGDAGSVGLGLFIVRELVRAHGGTVEVRSSAEHGTTFTVRLPHARAASAGCPAAER